MRLNVQHWLLLRLQSSSFLNINTNIKPIDKARMIKIGKFT